MKYVAVLIAVAILLFAAIAEAGSVYGSRKTYDTLAIGFTHTYDLAFKEGEVAAVLVQGDHRSDLDCEVRDYYGNLMDIDDDLTDVCFLEFVPKYTGNFVLKIKNVGTKPTRYRLETN